MLTFLSIHATDYHASEFDRTVLNRIVFCYTLTAKTLTYARERKDRVRKELLSSMLLVDMSVTSEETSEVDDLLQHVEFELEAIINLISKSMMMHLLLESNKSKVVIALEIHSMIHFACHGKSNTENSSKSMLKLTN